MSAIAPISDNTKFVDIFHEHHDFNLKNNEDSIKVKNETMITLTVMVGEVVKKI